MRDVTETDVYKIESDFNKFFNLRNDSVRRGSDGKWIWDVEHLESLDAYCVCRNMELFSIKSQIGCKHLHCSCVCWDHDNHKGKDSTSSLKECEWPGHKAIKELAKRIEIET